MARTRPTNTQADYVAAALAIIDEDGLEALTTRTLGERLNVHGTAVYRHFPNREDLLAAVLDQVIAQVAAESRSENPDPKARLRETMMAARRTLAMHPNLLVPLITGNGLMPSGMEITTRVLTDLEDMGLTGRSLAVAHQMIESFLIGSTAFDFAGAPNHLEMRRVRRRMLAHEAYDPVTRTPEQIGELNDESFAMGCDSLLDACARLAAGT